MSLIKTFAKFSVGTWIGALISLLSAPITAWFINPGEFGKASMFTLAYNLLINIVVLGTDQSFSRFYIDVDNKKKYTLLKSVLIPSLGLFLLVSIIIVFFKEEVSVVLFGETNHFDFVYLLCFMVLIGLLSRFGLLSIRMKSEALKFSKIQIISAFLSFITVIGYAKFISNTFQAIVITSVFSQFLILVLTIFYDQGIWIDLIRNLKGLDRIGIRKYLIYGLPFVPTFMLDWVFQGADRTFLRYYSDYSQLGLYALAFKISLSLNIVQSGFATFWLPFSLEKYNNEPTNTDVYSSVFNTLTFVFGVLITLIILGQEILTLILPKSYNGIVPIFPFLLFIPMLYTLSEVTVVGINFKSKTIYHLFIIIASVVFNTLAAYLLVPKFGALGASIAMFVGYIIFFVCRSYYGRKHYFFSLDIKKFVIAFIFILLPVIITVFFTGSRFYIVGVLSLFILWFLYKEDIRRIKTIK